jgi:hypothetical protein
MKRKNLIQVGYIKDDPGDFILLRVDEKKPQRMDRTVQIFGCFVINKTTYYYAKIKKRSE